ncbi:glycerate dehydrogenase [Thozetella sp. PMI_491]|nr:glycerate dehydrogenase [Thozetella sp. PMI_491]
MALSVGKTIARGSHRAAVTRSMATAASQRGIPSLAILNDYLDTSVPHFSHIPPSKLAITRVPDAAVSGDDSSVAALAARLAPFTLVSTMRERTPFPAALLRQLPNLKVLLATGTQFETFDLAAAKELGITVVAAPGRGRTDRPRDALQPNIKTGSGHPTVQHTWALILALARNVAADDAVLRAGPGWQSGLAIGLSGKTFGVLGLGRLGAAAARIAVLAWGMRVVCWSANMTQERADSVAAGLGLPVEMNGEKTFRAVSKEELFQEADVVSLHYVLSPRSQGLVGEAELGLMKPEALLVNSSRGPLIDGDALLHALEGGKIHGAALDVFDVEPLPADSPWRKKDYWGQNGRSKLLITPHMGYVNKDLMNNWYEETAENVERWLDNKELLHRLV